MLQELASVDGIKDATVYEKSINQVSDTWVFMQKKETVDRRWFVIDAKGKPLGRVASTAAHVLRGKHKATYTPHIDCGDYVIIVNAKETLLTGNKLDKNMYYNRK